jgi:S1-C subfamily serine protease
MGVIVGGLQVSVAARFRTLFAASFWTALIALFPVVSAAAFDVPQLQEGATTDTLQIVESTVSYATYRFTVDSETLAVRLHLRTMAGDLDLFVKQGEEILTYSDVDYARQSADYSETLVISRFDDPPLRDGEYYLDVAYQRSELPTVKGRSVSTVPYELQFHRVDFAAEEEIDREGSIRGTLSPDRGMVATYLVRVPPKAEALRVDLSQCDGDLDLYMRPDAPIRSRGDATFVSEEFVSRESLTVERDLLPAEGGTFYVTVIDQIARYVPASFTLHVGFRDSPPASLLEYPTIPIPEDALARSIKATVEVIGSSGRGSGCIVSPDGLVLTNWHVVKAHSGEAESAPVIAVSVDDTRPPVELFRSTVLHYDPTTDLALLQIDRGYYDQPLPDDLVLPHVPLGDPSELLPGHQLALIGYPSEGGTGSRVSVTYSRGVVSGFERRPFGRIIKTDALVNGGSSGGAALNGDFQLVGLPTEMVGEQRRVFGFIYPVSLIPDAWAARIDGAGVSGAAVGSAAKHVPAGLFSRSLATTRSCGGTPKSAVLPLGIPAWYGER